MYDKYTDDIIGDTAKERVTQQTKQFHGNWHNLTRTNHIQACWKMLNVITQLQQLIVLDECNNNN